METLYHAGVALMALCAVGGIGAAIGFRASGRRLRRQLEREYGKRKR